MGVSFWPLEISINVQLANTILWNFQCAKLHFITLPLMQSVHAKILTFPQKSAFIAHFKALNMSFSEWACVLNLDKRFIRYSNFCTFKIWIFQTSQVFSEDLQVGFENWNGTKISCPIFFLIFVEILIKKYCDSGMVQQILTYNNKQPLAHLFEILFRTPSCQFISEIWLCRGPGTQ